jgi:hypothetical protein
MNTIATFDKLIETSKVYYTKTSDSLLFKRELKIFNATGVTGLINYFHKKTHEKSNGKSEIKEYYEYLVSPKDYEICATNVPIPTTTRKNSDFNLSEEHDAYLNSLHKSTILSRCGYKCINYDEVFVGDKDLVVQRLDKEESYFTPFSLFDFACINDNGDLVLGEVKSTRGHYPGFTLERIFLRQDTARQLHIYGKMLEYMASKNGLSLKVSHYLILGISTPKNHNHTMGLWKLNNNPSKWIDGVNNDKEELNFFPMKFKEKLPTGEIRNIVNRYTITAIISDSISPKRKLILINDKSLETKSKFFLYDKTEQLILKKFTDLKKANEWVIGISESIIESLYKEGNTEKQSILIQIV